MTQTDFFKQSENARIASEYERGPVLVLAARKPKGWPGKRTVVQVIRPGYGGMVDLRRGQGWLFRTLSVYEGGKKK